VNTDQLSLALPGPRVSRVTIGRLHNLGNYEHIRYEVTVELPPGTAPASVVRELEDTLNALAEVANGTATEQTLWDMAEAVFTWHRVAERLGEGEPEMAPQLLLAAKVIERYGATGRIEFEGDEYAQAQTGVDVMDALAIRTDVATATEAAHWSDAYLARLVSEFRAENREAAHG
jgi:hypothetical protein